MPPSARRTPRRTGAAVAHSAQTVLPGRTRSTDELAWFKSTYSGSSGDNCIEVALLPGTVLVRDSKDTARQGLSVSREAWYAFTTLATRPRA